MQEDPNAKKKAATGHVKEEADSDVPKGEGEDEDDDDDGEKSQGGKAKEESAGEDDDDDDDDENASPNPNTDGAMQGAGNGNSSDDDLFGGKFARQRNRPEKSKPGAAAETPFERLAPQLQKQAQNIEQSVLNSLPQDMTQQLN